jgi:hypothetical protein
VEARNRAIVDRTRAASPAPANRHRRDRSTGGSESTRFPINVSSSSTTTAERRAARHSLDVPGSAVSPTAVDGSNRAIPHPADPSTTNGGRDHTGGDSAGSMNNPPTLNDTASPTGPRVAKSDSLSRSGGRYSRITAMNRNTLAEDERDIESLKPLGVTLEDKAMDD